MSPESPESPNWIIGPTGEKESRKSSISLDTGLVGLPAIPGHQLDQSGVIKLALSEAVSAALEASGEFHLLITTPADATTPEHLRGRRLVLALPVTREMADAAYRVASGKARAVTIKTPTQAKA